jgi:phage terminase large subunit-like protein
MAYHLTGQYPSWWVGKVFDKPVRSWCAGVTNESVRDVLQDKLIGPPTRRGEWGTGMIPKACIGEVSMARGVPDLIDTVSVLHITGGYSQLQFKSYSEGRQKWQGVGLEVVYLDEEPPEDLYFEALTRISETGGIIYTVFTPLLGMSSVVRMFLHEGIKI